MKRNFFSPFLFLFNRNWIRELRKINPLILVEKSSQLGMRIMCFVTRMQLSLSRLESREAINANCGFINFHPCFRWLKVTAGNPGELRTRSPGPHVDLVGSRKVDGLNVYAQLFCFGCCLVLVVD